MVPSLDSCKNFPIVSSINFWYILHTTLRDSISENWCQLPHGSLNIIKIPYSAKLLDHLSPLSSPAQFYVILSPICGPVMLIFFPFFKYTMLLITHIILNVTCSHLYALSWLIHLFMSIGRVPSLSWRLRLNVFSKKSSLNSLSKEIPTTALKQEFSS